MENNTKKYFYFFENQKISIDEAELYKLIEEAIIEILINDPYAMPLKVLLFKVIKVVKEKKQNLFIRHDVIEKVIETLLETNILGISKFQKYFIDYLDYPEDTVEKEGFLNIDDKRGNGYITENVKKEDGTFSDSKLKKQFSQKSTHFVHKKNLNSAKSGDYVKFVELIVNIKKKNLKLSLKDSKVKEILTKKQS